MEVLELIKTELKKLGLSENYATLVVALFKPEKAEDVAGAITQFKETTLPAIEAEVETKAKSKADRDTQLGIQTAISNYEKKHGLKDGKPAGTPPKTDVPPEGETAIEKMIREQQVQIQKLSEMLTGVVTTQTANQKIEVARKLIAETQIPQALRDKWIKKVDPLSETTLEDQIKALEADYLEDRQIEINLAVEGGVYKPNATASKTLTEEEYRKIMNGEGQTNTGTVPLEIAKK